MIIKRAVTGVWYDNKTSANAGAESYTDWPRRGCTIIMGAMTALNDYKE